MTGGQSGLRCVDVDGHMETRAKACCGVYEKQDVRSILINFWNMNYVTFHYLWQT